MKMFVCCSTYINQYHVIRYYNRRDAEDAMDRLDGSRLDGREIRVSRAQHARPDGAYNPRDNPRDNSRRSR